MILIRSIVFSIVFYTAFILLMIVGSPCLLVSRKAAGVIVKTWARMSVALLRLICGTRVEFRNLHLLPAGPAILAVKHQSFLETFALITVMDDFSYVLKKELTAIPFFGWYIKATEQISIDRGRKGGVMALLQRGVSEKLKLRRQVVIFPEGTRRPVGVPPLYKSGVAALCATADLPCTPVALNTGLFWPRHTIIRRPGTVVIEFLPPIAMTGSKSSFMQELQTTIETHSDALVAAALRDDPGLDRMLTKRTPAAI